MVVNVSAGPSRNGSQKSMTIGWRVGMNGKSADAGTLQSALP
jgi:hypothetical protein